MEVPAGGEISGADAAERALPDPDREGEEVNPVLQELEQGYDAADATAPSSARRSMHGTEEIPEGQEALFQAAFQQESSSSTLQYAPESSVGDERSMSHSQRADEDNQTDEEDEVMDMVPVEEQSEESRREQIIRQTHEESIRKNMLQEENFRLQSLVAKILQQKAEGGATGAAGASTLSKSNSMNAEDSGETKAAMANSVEMQKRYTECLENIEETTKTLENLKISHEKTANELQLKLEEKEAKAKDIHSSFSAFKKEIARQAQNSRTNRPISEKVLTQLEQQETEKDKEIEKMRIRNITLQSHVRKLESQLQAKEQLAEGLHLIDFEQLKIENQSLQEKIEERNEELTKLRKKTTNTVQVLTHVKEKLQFVNVKTENLKSTLGSLDKDLIHEKDKLTKAKKERDRLRAENQKMKVQQGFSKNDLLVADFEKRKAEIAILEKRVADLKQRHHELSQKVVKAKDKDKKSQTGSGQTAPGEVLLAPQLT